MIAPFFARTINRIRFPSTTSSKPDELHKRVIFNVGDPVSARDFRPGQIWTTGTVIRGHVSVLHEFQVNREIWIRHRNQLKH